MKKVLIFLGILAVLCVGCFFFVLNYLNGLDGPLEKGGLENKIITIPSGSSTLDIGEILEGNEIIKDKTGFRIFSKLNQYDGKYIAGTYTLSSGMTTTEICEKISKGETTATVFTIPEGYTVDQIIDVLVKEGYGTRESFLEVIENGDFDEYDFIEKDPSLIYELEGYLFPETYSLDHGASEEAIIKAMVDHFDQVFDANMRKRAEELGYSIREIVTIASIIEKESILDEDRPLVSSVIYNRLDIDMRLGMDTTVLYVMDEHKVDLTYDDIEVDSPYNTYLNYGLPPGPICCPGKASLEAALYPAVTDYYYFVVSDKGDGSIAFSETEEQFEKDKAAYYDAKED